MGCITPLGQTFQETYDALLKGKNVTKLVPEWRDVYGLNSSVGSFVSDYDVRDIPRKKRRTMSKMSEMICLATKEALNQANLLDDINNKRVMIIAGSTSGSPITFGSTVKGFYAKEASEYTPSSTHVFKCISSSNVINLAAFLDFQGPAISVNAACSTSSQAIIMGKQFIDMGFVDIAIVGGSDECNELSVATFDKAFAATRKNEFPKIASKPFDKERDGIVVSEGASIVILESEKSLKERQVTSYGRVMGGAYLTDGNHIVHPSSEAISLTIEKAIRSSNINKNDIGYVNAHATSTIVGDQAEADSVHKVLGERPISSLKGHFGHTFAACGAIELMTCLKMLHEKKVIGTLNLKNVDDNLPPLEYLFHSKSGHTINKPYFLSNNFAFGGMNTSIILGL